MRDIRLFIWESNMNQRRTATHSTSHQDKEKVLSLIVYHTQLENKKSFLREVRREGNRAHGNEPLAHYNPVSRGRRLRPAALGSVLPLVSLWRQSLLQFIRKREQERLWMSDPLLSVFLFTALPNKNVWFRFLIHSVKLELSNCSKCHLNMSKLGTQEVWCKMWTEEEIFQILNYFCIKNQTCHWPCYRLHTKLRSPSVWSSEAHVQTTLRRIWSTQSSFTC